MIKANIFRTQVCIFVNNFMYLATFSLYFDLLFERLHNGVYLIYHVMY